MIMKMKISDKNVPMTKKETWINQETGEIREFVVVSRPYSSDFNFHKVWLDDLVKILGILGGGKISVFNYILENINPYNNEFGGTYAEIAEKSGVHVNTVKKTIKILVRENFMKRVRVATYMINSRFLVKGTHNKRMGLMLKYDELNDTRQLELFGRDEQGIDF